MTLEQLSIYVLSRKVVGRLFGSASFHAGNLKYGASSDYRQQGAACWYFGHLDDSDGCIGFALGGLNSRQQAEVKNYLFWACRSGGNSFPLYLPQIIIEQIQALPLADENDGQIQEIRSKIAKHSEVGKS